MGKPHIVSSRENFINARARLTRVRDAKIVYGWIEDLSDQTLHLKLQSNGPIDFDEAFIFEISGVLSSVRFGAVLCRRIEVPTAEHPEEGEAASSVAHLHEFRLNSEIQSTASSQAPRFQAANMRAALTICGEVRILPIEDVAPGGIGAYSDRELQQGTLGHISIPTRLGPVEGIGEVRYCRSVPDQPGKWRVGIQFQEMGRVDKGRWDDLLLNSRALTWDGESGRSASARNQLAESGLIGTGVRMKLHRSGSILSGWLLMLDDRQALVETESMKDIEVDDSVAIEVFGYEQNLALEGTVREHDGTCIAFDLADAKVLQAPREAKRTSIPGITAEIVSDDEEPMQITVVDVSHQGLMFVSLNEFERASRLQFRVITEFGSIVCGGEVRYCKPVRDGKSFRIGVMLDALGRIERGRWQRFIESAA